MPYFCDLTLFTGVIIIIIILFAKVKICGYKDIKVTVSS